MSRHPRVSIVVPAYQCEFRIRTTLARVTRQSFTDFEIIVVNDGSTDQTSATVRRLMDVDSRIRLLEQTNQGIAAARNHGIEMSRGKVLAFLDDDDLWHPRKLELQLAQLDASPHAAVVSCFSALVDPAGHVMGWRFGGSTEGDVYREMLEWDMVSGGSVALVLRRPLEEAGGFDRSNPYRADWDLWIRLARRHHFTFVPHTLVGYTRRAGSASQRYDRMIDCGRDVLAKARREDPTISAREYRAFVARDLFGTACFCLVDDQRSMAWRYLARALRSEPVIVLARPRRWGIMLMLILSSALPGRMYRATVVAAMSRVAFHLKRGEAFDSLK